MLWDLTTNWSGLEFETLITVLDEVGFSSSANMDVDTPSGDFRLFMMTGCLAVHFKLSSNKI